MLLNEIDLVSDSKTKSSLNTERTMQRSEPRGFQSFDTRHVANSCTQYQNFMSKDREDDSDHRLQALTNLLNASSKPQDNSRSNSRKAKIAAKNSRSRSKSLRKKRQAHLSEMKAPCSAISEKHQKQINFID